MIRTFALVLGIGGAFMGARPARGEPVKVNVYSIPARPTALLLRIGRDNKYFEQEGLDVHEIAMNIGSGAVNPITALGSGAVDVAEITFNTTQLGLMRQTGVKIVAGGAMRVKGKPAWDYYIVRKDLADRIKTFADLKGRTIGISSVGLRKYLWLLRGLEKSGLTAKDFTAKPIVGSVLVPARLLDKELDVTATLEPKAGQIVRKGLAEVFAGSDIADETAPVTVFAYSKGFMENAEAARRFMIALMRCRRDFSRKSPEQLRDLALEVWGPPIDAGLISRMHLADAGAIDARELMAEQRDARRFGLIKEEVPENGIIDSSYVRLAGDALRHEAGAQPSSSNGKE